MTLNYFMNLLHGFLTIHNVSFFNFFPFIQSALAL